MEIGFIILRHVNSEKTNLYWQHSYDCVRQFYPLNKIVIIDDNSNYDYITEKNLTNTQIVQSEYPARGELLPYYYYSRNKYFDKAVIIHDSVFINSQLNLNIDNYRFLWHFNHNYNDPNLETMGFSVFNDQNLIDFYESQHLWKGCFGAMMIIKHDFLVQINQKYDLSLLTNLIKTRSMRSCFERIMSCLCVYTHKKYNESLLGNISYYCTWGISFERKDELKNLPVIKVWTGR